MIYSYIIFEIPAMRRKAENEEIHWQAIKAMLDEFAELRGKNQKIPCSSYLIADFPSCFHKENVHLARIF